MYDIFAIYQRNWWERHRNPSFEMGPRCVACSAYAIAYRCVTSYGGAQLQNQNSKIKNIALEILAFVSSLGFSAALCTALRYSPETWAYDLLLYAATTSITTIIKIITASNSAFLNTATLLSGDYARNVLESARNPSVDPVSLTVPTACYIAGYFTTPEFIKKFGFEKSENQKWFLLAIPALITWGLTPGICSLLGRKVVAYPAINILIGPVALLCLNKLNEVLRRWESQG